MKTSLYLFAVVAMCVSAGCRAPQADADYTPSNVLNCIMASQKTVSNATFECVWKDLMDGSSRWEQQTFYWDHLGRRRILSHDGPLSQDGKMLEDEDPTSRDALFNGEIVVDASSHPKRARDGLQPASPKDAVGFNQVSIGTAGSASRDALERTRNPLEFMGHAALPIIAAAIKEGAAAAQPAEDGRVAIAIRHTAPEAPCAMTMITVAPKHNWAIESVRSYSSDGKLAREYVCDYQEQADGLWAPIRLRATHWEHPSQIDRPDFDWRFETTKARLNDPSFDPHVFDVRFVQLKPDTVVSDTRYGVTYRVGKEGATGGDLDQYAANEPRAKAPSLVGKALPDLTPLELAATSSTTGEPVVVLLIDADQRPSRRSLKVLTDEAAALKEKHVAVIILQAGSMADAAYTAWLQETASPFPIARLRDTSAKGLFVWGARSLPWLILADKNHRVVAEGFPIEDLDAKLKEPAN